MALEYDLHPWPRDVMPAVHCLLAYYRKTDPDLNLKEVGHAAWHLIGYAGGQVDPHPVLAGAALTEKGFVQALEAIEATDASYGAVPWALLLQFAMLVLEKLLKDS
jgi:hypothetical protein